MERAIPAGAWKIMAADPIFRGVVNKLVWLRIIARRARDHHPPHRGHLHPGPRRPSPLADAYPDRSAKTAAPSTCGVSFACTAMALIVGAVPGTERVDLRADAP